MSAMLKKIGDWIGRHQHRHVITAEDIAVLGGYRSLSPARLDSMVAGARLEDIEQGLIGTRLAADRRYFLYQGSLQIQTRSGFVLSLRAGTPQARYPVPLPPRSVTLFAAEPSRLLGVPLNPPATPANAPEAISPVLSADERTALDGLRRHFNSAGGELPSLPDLAVKISRAIDDASNNDRDIARIIQLDPALTTRLLAIVNSPAFGGYRKISTINQAATRLGRARVRSLVYSCLIRSIFKTNARELQRRMQEIWQRSVSVAALSFVLGRQTPGIDAEHAMLAGLVHDIGTVAVIGSLSRFPLLCRRAELLDFAIRQLRIEAGIRAVKQWDLLSDLDSVVRSAGNWQRIGTAVPETVDIVNLAMLHAAVGTPRATRLPPIDSIPAFDKLQHGRLSPQQSLHLLEEAESDVREVRRLLGQG
jgi:HD-like signal output (HDOD) protein